MKKSMCVLSAFMLLFVSSCSSDKLSEATVTVSGGVVQGTVEDGLAVFKGIPFAAPPVGDLRWKAPQPVEPWEGVLQTKQFGPAPIQPAVQWMGEVETSEDCLYLNIWTPAKSAREKLPVMVWIYGGGFANGSASFPVNYGDQIAKHGVILVSITYRVGPLGFLAHQELTAESENGVSGNYGLLDQIAGLKWVQENIAAFGGDPGRVTIFGESAGAISVSMLCASPLAKGLFIGAISQSGGSFAPVSEERSEAHIQNLKGAEKSGAEFAGRMGAGNIKELRTLAPEKLITDPNSQMGGFWPVVDGYVITGDQYKLYEEGRFNDVNVIIGTNSDEGSLFMSAVPPAQYTEMIKKRFGPMSDRLFELYPGRDENEVYTSLADLFSITVFGWPSYAWARLQTEKGTTRVFVYYFDQFRNGPLWPDGPIARGAAHASEIPYVFGKLGTGSDYAVSDDEKALGDIMIQYWTNFAKSGDPNGEDLPVWPVFRNEGETVMHLIGTGSSPISVPDYERLMFMDEYFSWLRNNK